MTERSPGAPDPVGPSNSGGTREQGSRPPAPAVTLLADLGAVRRTDAIIDALAARRAVASTARPATDRPAADRPVAERPAADRGAGERARAADDGDEVAADPAVRLLRALIADVDDQDAGRAAGPADPGPGTPPTAPGPGPRRRGPRTIVALGVAGAVLASTGVAAAGSGITERAAASPPAGTGVSGPVEPHAKDTAPGTRSVPRTAPPAQASPPSVPGPERPAAKAPAAEDPGRQDYDRMKRRLEHLLRTPDRPHRSAPRRPDTPAVPAIRPVLPTAPSDGDARRTIEDIRKRAQKRLAQYENPDPD
ncbi:hypothetical protein [Actinomadura verrucosospora]|uniref:Uncharacterized protein n=1 Tax=Actinomadura verrucosospora TaxID=46165 RepID=A0A7D4A4F3_ACTVE|nr:hypothetical protein [Actinomadura verrucosospora]QKG24904.1 hypothetical protein ACTIVE_6555 [Actinomadura verrucosospora]